MPSAKTASLQSGFEPEPFPSRTSVRKSELGLVVKAYTYLRGSAPFCFALVQETGFRDKELETFGNYVDAIKAQLRTAFGNIQNLASKSFFRCAEQAQRLEINCMAIRKPSVDKQHAFWFLRDHEVLPVVSGIGRPAITKVGSAGRP